MEKPTLGGIVESRCGKCNDVTGHVVTAMVGGVIVKVECRACGATHCYRPPNKGALPGRAKTPGGASRPPAASGARSGAKSSGRSTLPREQAARWQEARNRAEYAGVRTYSPQDGYSGNTLIRHAVFGLGEVLAVIPPDKMDVLFEEGVKRLLCNKAMST